MSKVLADNNLKQYRAKFKPPRYFIPASSYSVYKPQTRYDEDSAARHSRHDGEDRHRPDTSYQRPTDISRGIEVSNAEEQQPEEVQIDEDFFE